MTYRTALLSAAALTTFVVVLAVGLAGQIAGAASTPAAATPPSLSPTAAPTDQPPLPALLEEREAAYRQQLEAANGQLRQAAEQQAALLMVNQQLRDLAAAPAEAASTPPAGGQVSRDQAIQAALAYLGGGTVKEVELEREHGAVVYEVEFTSESKVYVDAATGQVAFAKVRDDRSGRQEDHDDD